MGRSIEGVEIRLPNPFEATRVPGCCSATCTKNGTICFKARSCFTLVKAPAANL